MRENICEIKKFGKIDAECMLEWMHDCSIVENMNADFASKTIENCEGFIRAADVASNNLHLAIADEKDNYMGTVSLKNIVENSAEFTITVRKAAMGKGYAKYGMEEIIKIGFQKFGLQQIYWCVSPKNRRAVRFYDKNGYKRICAKLLNIVGCYSTNQIEDYIWYRVLEEEVESL